MWLSLLGIFLKRERPLVQFLVRAHARVVGLAPGQSATNRCFSPHLPPFEINQYILKSNLKDKQVEEFPHPPLVTRLEVSGTPEGKCGQGVGKTANAPTAGTSRENKLQTGLEQTT